MKATIKITANEDFNYNHTNELFSFFNDLTEIPNMVIENNFEELDWKDAYFDDFGELTNLKFKYDNDCYKIDENFKKGEVIIKIDECFDYIKEVQEMIYELVDMCGVESKVKIEVAMN